MQRITRAIQGGSSLSDLVELYTRQHENSIFEISRKGEMTNKEIFVRLHMGPDASYFMERYRTFVKLAERIVPRPEGTEYPIWTSISKNNCLKPIPGSIVYCLQVPKEEIIYLDGLKWDYVLNYLYVPLDEDDNRQHQIELRQRGIETEHFIINGKYKGMFPDLESKIQNSWKRIFDIDEWNEFVVQANLWHIKEDWITRILHLGDDIFEKPEENFQLKQHVEIVKQRQVQIQTMDFEL